MSEQEYLGTHYEPDCEFEDGALIERHVGTEKHSWLQAALAAYFFRRRKAWNVNVYAEQRNCVRPGKYKLPDVCVTRGPRAPSKNSIWISRGLHANLLSSLQSPRRSVDSGVTALLAKQVKRGQNID